jgi:hypothetical protein
MLRRVALVGAEVAEECFASVIRVIRIGELGTTLALTSNRSTLRRNTMYSYAHIVFIRSVLRLRVATNVVTSSPILVSLMIEAIYSTESSVLTRPTRRNIPEGGIFLVTAVKTSDLTNPIVSIAQADYIDRAVACFRRS